MTGTIQCDGSDLCVELAGGSNSEFRRTYPDLEHRVLKESDGSAAIIDLSPMAVGHILVCTRAHYYNIADALVDPNSDLMPFLLDFIVKYEEAFGDYAILEHGSTEDMAGSACISHAHLHLIPLSANKVFTCMEDDGLALTSLSSWIEFSAATTRTRKPYFLASDGRQFRVALAPPPMRSQYFRSVIGRLLMIPIEECDWALVMRRELFYETRSKWDQYLRQVESESTGIR